MFHMIDRIFQDAEYGTSKYLEDWPLLYILENGKQAYIGQSIHAKQRMEQHKKNPEKIHLHFSRAHFIYSPEFNQSVTFDYESQLIRLFAADEQFTITNDNGGIADGNYFRKEYYDDNFRHLWNYLLRKKLSRHTIEELTDSDLFKYSPYKTLNESQRKAVEDIAEIIKTEPHQAVVVHGMPGSGKTIVAVFLIKYLRDYTDPDNGLQPYRNKEIAIVIPQTSLRKTLKSIFKRVYGLKPADVIGPTDVTRKKYDILIVDEAHRLHQRKNIMGYKSHDDGCRRIGLPIDATELDWILKQCTCPILLYDADQVIGPSGMKKDMLLQKIRNDFPTYIQYTLDTQMRVKGGNDYIDYIKHLLCGDLEGKRVFDKYEFKLFTDFKSFCDLYHKLEDDKGLTRMVAGYAWKWISKNDKTLKDIEIEGIKIMWNNCTEGWVHTPTAPEEVGCIHSIQGYDLNYAFIILGKDIRYDIKSGKILADRENYFDENGLRNANDEELNEYIKNIYYVLMTRGVYGTYLYICDDPLREYMEKYVDKYEI